MAQIYQTILLSYLIHGANVKPKVSKKLAWGSWSKNRYKIFWLQHNSVVMRGIILQNQNFI